MVTGPRGYARGAQGRPRAAPSPARHPGARRPLTTETAIRRVAIYVRVSSEDQAERGTIRTQVSEIRRRLEHEAGIVVVGEYSDEGISGTVPLSERPEGSRLIADARGRRFDEVWVYRLDRLGRDLVGLALARRELDGLGIRPISA